MKIIKFKEKLGDYFKYYKDEVMTIKDANVNLEQKARDYSKKDTRLFARKEKLYSEKNPKQWDLIKEDFNKYSLKDFEEDKPLAMKLMLPKVSILK